MRTTRAVVGALFFGVVILIALGSSAVSIGGIYGQSRDNGLIGLDGPAVLGETVVMTGEGFGPGANVLIELAADRADDAVVAHPTTADADGNVRFPFELIDPVTAGTWVVAMHGQTADGATRILWEHSLVVSAPVQHFCKGELATIVGTDGDDVLIGTSGPDVIVGLDGDDEIRGLQGDDLICAGPGDDEVRGGKGADEIHGQRGADRLRGQSGQDRINGGSGSDRIWGGSAADRIRGNGSADVIKGGSGADNIGGGSGADDLRGNSGHDTIKGNKGADAINGGKGTDDCVGGSGTDAITDCE